MHVHLAPGESLLPGTRERLDALFADPQVEAVLLPLVPSGDHALARSARSYLEKWDRRFLHRQNFFAPASRVASRVPLPGHLNGEAAPVLADALDRGARLEALPTHTGLGVSTPIARDLDAWLRWAREEGSAWGRAAANDARLAGFLPARTRRGWLNHNVHHVSRRVGETLEAMRRVDPLALTLHVTREAAWTGAAMRAYQTCAAADRG